MRKYKAYSSIFLVASLLSLGSNASGQCVDAKPPFGTVPAGTPKVLRKTTPIQELADFRNFVTRPSPNFVTKLTKGTTKDCKNQTVFPDCSELKISLNQPTGRLSVTLTDTETGNKILDALPLKPSTGGVDFLYSDPWSDPASKNSFVFFVYLLYEPTGGGAGTVDKHYVIEAFDTSDKVCEAQRPDQQGNIAKFNPDTVYKKETDTTQGHEGKP